MRSAVLLAAAGALALSAGFATYYLTGGKDRLMTVRLSADADVPGLLALRLPDMHGVETSIGAMTDKVLVVNFWATWCAPCREEMPDFVRLQSEFGPQGVRFVGIAAERGDKIPAFADEIKINYPLLVADFAAIDMARRLGNVSGGLPFTVVLDRERKVVHRELGKVEPAKLRAMFADLLR